MGESNNPQDMTSGAVLFTNNGSSSFLSYSVTKINYCQDTTTKSSLPPEAFCSCYMQQKQEFLPISNYFQNTTCNSSEASFFEAACSLQMLQLSESLMAPNCIIDITKNNSPFPSETFCSNQTLQSSESLIKTNGFDSLTNSSTFHSKISCPNRPLQKSESTKEQNSLQDAAKTDLDHQQSNTIIKKATTRPNKFQNTIVRSPKTNRTDSNSIHSKSAAIASTELRNNVKKNKHKFDELKCAFDKEKEQFDERLDLFDQAIRYNTIRIFGVDEESDEDVYQLVINILKKKMNIVIDCSDISEIYRSESQRLPKPIIVRFNSNDMKHEILKRKKNLKGSSFRVIEDLSPGMVKLYNVVVSHFGKGKVWVEGGIVKVAQSDRPPLKFRCHTEFKEHLKDEAVWQSVETFVDEFQN